MGTWFGREKKPAFLSIDLETRSEVDLGKCGVYKYVEGEHWGILLFCYLFEGDEDVSEVDMASGEPLPEDVLAALEDPEIVKYAWNASFERTNLSKHLGRRLDPRQWKCTMVWAAELSLPLSLKNAAAVLKVDQQKDRAGDALIRKFSVPQKPTKSNGMKEWLGPSDLPEQWAAFKSYCRQDVRTEDAIRRRLEKFPLPMSEWEMYWIDQDINDRGIKIDLDLAKAAMECDRQMGGKMMDEARELTGLENPNSVQQMKGWLGAHNTFLATLGKEEVQEMISQMEGDPDADQDALRMLKLRLQMAKSSIKKYEAAVRCTCEDGRARGLFQFYGASRTGRFCLTGDHEVLTEDGWVRLDEWKGGKIACWSTSAWKVCFMESISLRFPYKGPMYSIEGPYVSQLSTPEHKMLYSRGKILDWDSCTVRELMMKVPVSIIGWHSDDPVGIWEGEWERCKVQDIPELVSDFMGTVYCAQTPTGYFVVRRNGKAWVTGNSGRHIQLQNLSKNYVSYLDDVRSLVRSGAYDALDLICGNVPDILSQCVRTMLVPKPGHEFIVADFSAIEARCIAWEAGEESVLKDFRDGKDLYCAMASRMFGVPVEKHGQNAELRSRGKIATLACISEGELVLTDKGLVPIQNVTTEMKVWDGEEWVQHDGVVYQGIRDVISYGGLTATEDHLVWVENEQYPIYFGIAARTHKNLVQTESSGNPIRMGENHKPRIIVGLGYKSLCKSGMPSMQRNSMGGILQLTKTPAKILPGLFKSSIVAAIQNKSCQTPLREPERPSLQKLWWPWNQIQLSIRKRCGDLYSAFIRHSEQRIRAGSNRLQWRLRTWKYPICTEDSKPTKQKKHSINQIRTAILAIYKRRSDQEIDSRLDERRDNRRCQNSCEDSSSTLERNKRKARVYDIRNAGRHHRFTVSGVLVHNCGYGGSAGAMTSMGALKMGLKEEELPDIVQAYRDANPNIVRFWWDLDDAATRCIRDHQDHEAGPVRFELRSNVLWMVLPSGRSLAYIAPRIGKNRFGGKSIEFMGVGLNNKWQTIETYGAKLSENCLREGTLVLTRANGWKPIEQISPEDELWDGEEWVPTKGSAYKGDRAVIEVSFAHHGGIYMTPDHRILTDDGWTEAGNADGRCWKEAGIPDSQAFREKLPGYRTRPTGWNRISIYQWSSVYQDMEIAPVYDIVDCGPRSRFCVLDPGTGDLRIVHNCTQAIARDILCNSIRNLEAEGIHVVAHVHDECICEVPIGRYSVDDICSIMARNPEWCRDLPLTAAGYLAPDYYFKD